MKRLELKIVSVTMLGLMAMVAPVPPAFGARQVLAAEPRHGVSLNSATSQDLRKLPGIGELMAQRIIAARPFRSLDELRRVSGMTPKRYAKLKEKIRL